MPRRDNLEEFLNSPVSRDSQAHYEAEISTYQKTFPWYIANEYAKSLVRPRTFDDLIRLFLQKNTTDALPAEISIFKNEKPDLYWNVVTHMLKESVSFSSFNCLDVVLKEIKLRENRSEFTGKYKVKSFLSRLISGANSTGYYQIDRDRYYDCVSVLISHHPHKSFKYFANHKPLKDQYYCVGLFDICADLEREDLFEKQSRRAKILKLLCNKKFITQDLHSMPEEKLKENYTILGKLSNEDFSKLITSAKEVYKHHQTSGTRTTATVYAEKILSKIIERNKDISV